MYVKVRTMDGAQTAVFTISKLTSIDEFREMVHGKMQVTKERQRLFYRGKQMEDGYSMFDYNINVNDVIQLMVKPVLSETTTNVSIKPAASKQVVQSKSKQTSKVKYPCGCCGMGVGMNSVLCRKCNKWCHKRCSGLQSLKKVHNFWCPSCTETRSKPDDEQAVKESTREQDEQEVKEESVQEVKEEPVQEVKEELVQDGGQAAEECRESDYYWVGDLADGKCLMDGTWWEGKIVKITANPDPEASCSNEDDDGLLYHFVYERYESDPPSELLLKHVRPRARRRQPLEDLQPGDTVMANYNLEDPDQRGHWFDCKVTKVINTETEKAVIATVFVGADCNPMEDCHIKLVDEIFAVERSLKISERSENDESFQDLRSAPRRQNAPNCFTCKDNPKRKCNDCGCCKCWGKEDPHKQILCDECDNAYHTYCLDPPLDAVPDMEEWFCPQCKNDDTEIVKAGEKLKSSKKKAKMASAKGNTSRDWGKGYACVGRQKCCTIVAQNHFGPVPDVEVGTLWRFRLQASEAGVHRPHVAGIHGRETEGAYSIVLSGGYEDDEDHGDYFTYTGSGGRDLSGNKRTAEQSCDQKLTRLNRALAHNCNAPVSNEGAEATDWKGGKPVRVIRNAKGAKHSKFAPEEGIRYDGIYKVVKYWQDRGKSGFKVWKYLLRRDDPTPAPWTEEGRERIEQLGLTMQYPEGYLEAQQMKGGAGKETEPDQNQNLKTKGGVGMKRKRSLDSWKRKEDEPGSSKKRKSAIAYNLEKEVEALIKEDIQNCRLWDECKTQLTQGKAPFLSSVQDKFVCVCCQELVFQPITTVCSHNVCKSCIQRSFKAQVFTCPVCRHDLGNNHRVEVNKSLSECLQLLFPGYAASR